MGLRPITGDQPALARGLGQVAPILQQRVVAVLRRPRRDGVCRVVVGDALRRQRPHGAVRVLLGQRDEQRLHAHVCVPQKLRGRLRLSQNPDQAAARVLVGRVLHPPDLIQVRPQVGAEDFHVDPSRRQDLLDHVPRRSLPL